MGTWVSPQTFARQQGVTVGAIYQWRRQGRITWREEDGYVDTESFKGTHKRGRGPGKHKRRDAKIDPGQLRAQQEAADEKAIRNPDPAIMAAAQGENWTYLEAQRVKEMYLAKIRQVEYLKEIGEVVPLKDVNAKVADAFLRVKSRILAMPSALTPRLQACRTAGEQKAEIAKYAREIARELYGGGATAELGD